MTDESDVPAAMQRLRTVHHNLMELAYDNRRTKNSTELELRRAADARTPEELFADFFRAQNGREMNELERELLTQALFRQEVEA